MIDFSEDIDLMVSLLNEYSEKLLNVCSQINRFRKQLRGYVIASLSLIVFVSIFGYDFFIDSNLLFLKEKWQQIVFFYLYSHVIFVIFC